MHLQIAPKTHTPRCCFAETNTTFRESEKFLPQRWRRRWMLFPPNPVPDLFFQEWANMCKLRQRLLPRDQIACLDFPEKCAARGATEGALQNIGSFARFQRK